MEMFRIAPILVICCMFGCLFGFNRQIAQAYEITGSETISVSAYVAPDTPIDPAPGGGGGGGYIDPIVQASTSVTFGGIAYPYAVVTATQVSKKTATTTADSTGRFFLTLPATASASSSLLLSATDTQGLLSPVISYTMVVRDRYITQIQYIVFPPTISTNAFELTAKDTLVVSGFTQPSALVQSSIRYVGGEKSVSGTARPDGTYSISASLGGLPKGQYTVYSSVVQTTRLSRGVPLLIREGVFDSGETTANIPGDCNADEKVDLVDFSILAYWYKKPKPPSCVDVNRDGKVDIIDFSILAYYWTRTTTAQ